MEKWNDQQQMFLQTILLDIIILTAISQMSCGKQNNNGLFIPRPKRKSDQSE